jgi:hypothetical protein
MCGRSRLVEPLPGQLVDDLLARKVVGLCRGQGHPITIELDRSYKIASEIGRVVRQLNVVRHGLRLRVVVVRPGVGHV